MIQRWENVFRKMENEKFPNVTHNPPIVQSTSKISWEVFPLYSFSWRHLLWFPKYVAMFMLIWLQDSVTLYYAETDKVRFKLNIAPF